MRLRLPSVAAIGAVLAAGGSAPAALAQEGNLCAAADLSHRPVRRAPAFRSPTACTIICDMLNERDGGIGGVKITVEECETGYDTKKGVECYERSRARSRVVINP